MSYIVCGMYMIDIILYISMMFDRSFYLFIIEHSLVISTNIGNYLKVSARMLLLEIWSVSNF